MASLAVWRWSEGSISVNTVATHELRRSYWLAIMFSANPWHRARRLDGGHDGLGYEGGAVVFAIGLTIVAALYFCTKVSHTMLFAAIHPDASLGATVGDLLDKPVADGGIAFSRFTASAILGAVIVACILLLRKGRALIATSRAHGVN